MLVLQRKRGQAVYVGDTRIEVVECKGGGIRLGFSAPSDVRILRAELMDADSPTNPTTGNRLNGDTWTSERPHAADRRVG